MPHQSLHCIRCLPREFSNRRGQPIRLELLGQPMRRRLVAMYLAYQPRNSFQGLPPIRDEVCIKWVEDLIRDGVSIVALSAPGDVVGHVVVLPVNPRKCEMLVVVAPAFQDTGIGTELVRAAAEVARELGFQRMWLPVDAVNVRARHVYEKCGFEYASSRLARELDMALELAPQPTRTKPASPSCEAPPPPTPALLLGSLGIEPAAGLEPQPAE